MPEQIQSTLTTFFPLVLMVGVFYFLLIRPQKKKEREELSMRRSIEVGDSITTIGGIVGRVIAVKDEEDVIVLETGADRTKLAFKRWAIRSKDTIAE